MKWISSFKYVPVNYDECVAVIRNQTQRVSFDNNLNGKRIRLRLSNRYGKIPFSIDRVTVGVVDADRAVNTAAVTLDKKSRITLEAGQEIFSDEIDFTVHAGERLAVNIYIDQAQKMESICCLWAKTDTLVTFGAGDQTNGQAFEKVAPDIVLPVIEDDALPDKMMFFGGFNALQVYTDDEVKTVAAFGDSITHMSYMTNALGKRLYEAFPGKAALFNSGVGGNRLVHDAVYNEEFPQAVSVFGCAGIKRFERDVFEIDEVDSVLSLIGINDIMHPLLIEKKEETTSAEEIVEGYRTIIEIAHAHGARIYGGTIMPAGYSDYPESWMQAMEKTRIRVNEWIRKESAYDGYYDFDAALRDHEKTGYMLDDAHLGDGLHPNEKGGELAAAAVDIVELTGLER